MKLRSNLVFLVVLAVFGALSPLIDGLDSHTLLGVAVPQIDAINPYYYDILISIGINVILAVSLNLVNGYTGQFSLGHAGFMAVGAYTSAWITLQSVESGPGLFLLSLLAGGLVAAVTGFAVGVPSLRLRGDYLAIVTLGFNEIIRGAIQNADFLGAQRGLGGMIKHTDFFITYACAALTVLVVHNLVHSTYGRGFIATNDDEIAAEACGIPTTRYKITAFVVAALFAGIAGGLYAHFKLYLHPDGFGFMRSMDIVVMVVLGGMGSMVGVCLAAAFLTILPELLRYASHLEFLPVWLRHVAENRMIFYSLILIMVMLLRPQGLLNFKSGTSRQST
jgi:branched-chain amino acid transport system permease protein